MADDPSLSFVELDPPSMTRTRPVALFAVAASFFGSSALAFSCSTTSPGSPGAGVSSEAGADAGGAYLIALAVTAQVPGASPGLTLVPPFSSGTYDYYVPCAAGTNRLTVSMTASPESDSVLLQPTRGETSRTQTLDVSVAEGQAIVAAAKTATKTTEYWVRCLPQDFQPIEMVKNPGADAVTPGYYLVGDWQAPASGAPPYAMVIDSNGVPVWYYQQPRVTPFEPSTGVFNVDTLVDGAVSFLPWLSIQFTAPFEIHQLSPLVTTPLAATGWARNPHELRHLSNGNFLMFTFSTQTGVDLTGYAGLPMPEGGAWGPNQSIVPCTILEVTPAGEVAWKWVGTDYLDPVIDSTLPETADGPNGDFSADPFHCNSIDVLPESGDLVVSSRNMSSVFYVERSTGHLLWKMGGVPYTKNNAPYVPVPDPFVGQHDARVQPGWSSTCGGQGQISVFDDQSGVNHPARAVVYQVNVGVGGSAAGCGDAGATVAWQYPGTRNSWLMGSFRIASDGTRLIGWGHGGQFGRVFTEVDSNGNDLIEFYFTDGSESYRAIKVPLTALDLASMRSTAGLAGPVVPSGGDGGEGGSDPAVNDAGAGDATGG